MDAPSVTQKKWKVNTGDVGEFFVFPTPHYGGCVKSLLGIFHAYFHRESLKIDSLRPLHHLCAPCG